MSSVYFNAATSTDPYGWISEIDAPAGGWKDGVSFEMIKYNEEVYRIRNELEREFFQYAEEPIFRRIMDRFTSFFTSLIVSSSTVILSSGTSVSGGLWLANNFHSLVRHVAALPQHESETKLYVISSFINMGVSAQTMRGFAEFLKSGWAVGGSAVYTDENPMEWKIFRGSLSNPIDVDEYEM